MPENRFMKRLYKPRDFYRLLSDLESRASATRGLPKKKHQQKNLSFEIYPGRS